MKIPTPSKIQNGDSRMKLQHQKLKHFTRLRIQKSLLNSQIIIMTLSIK